MLRAYSRDIADAIAASREVSTYIPALAYTFAHNPTEIDVGARGARRRRVEVFAVQADPAQLRPRHRLLAGAAAAVLDVRHAGIGRCRLPPIVVVIAYRLLVAEWQGFATLHALWDRDILAFFLIGMLLFGLGLIGEYVGRIYQQVRERPRYTIRAVLETQRRSAGHARRKAARRDARRRLRVPQRRRALPRGAAAPGRRRAAGRHARGRSRRDAAGSARVAASPPRHGIAGHHAGGPERAGRRRARRAHCARISCSRFYYRRMLAPALLAIPARGALNMHGSLLPKYPRPRAGELGGAARRARDRRHAALHDRASPTRATSSRRPPCRSCPTTPRARSSTR